MNPGIVFKQRGKGVAGPDNATDPPARCLCFGVFQLDLQEQQLFKDGLKVKVQGKVYQALAALVETPGEIVTRDALRARLWRYERGIQIHRDDSAQGVQLRGEGGVCGPLGAAGRRKNSGDLAKEGCDPELACGMGILALRHRQAMVHRQPARVDDGGDLIRCGGHAVLASIRTA
jgi:hypothetical protein